MIHLQIAQGIPRVGTREVFGAVAQAIEIGIDSGIGRVRQQTIGGLPIIRQAVAIRVSEDGEEERRISLDALKFLLQSLA